MTRLRGNRWAVLLTLCLGFFMVLLDLTIVNIAIPSIIDGLKAGLDQILWVLNAYTLTYAVLLITAGRLGDRYGQRNLFTIGLALFTVSSAVCGLAQDPTQLIAARVAQGVGGALLTPQTLAILTTIFPAEKRGVAFGVWGAVAGVATIAGPTLGGVLVTDLDWRWIFYVNVPIGVLAVILSLLLIPDLRPGRRAGVEVVGVLLASSALFCVTFGLIEGQKYAWGTYLTVAGYALTIPEIIAAGFALLAAFFAWDNFRATPLVPLSLFGDRNFAVMNWVSGALSFAMVGFFLPLTIFLQSALGFTALEAGLTLVPMSVVSMLLAPWAGRLADRYDGRWIVATGLLLFAVGMTYINLRSNAGSDFLQYLPGTLLAGLGLGCTFAPLATVAMRDVQPRMAGAASGVLNTIRQLGGALGSAVVGAVLENRLAVTLHSQAVAHSSQLPAPARAPFVQAFAGAARGGLDVGRGQTGGSLSYAGLPPELAHQMAQAAHDVFFYGYLDAMRPALLVPAAALLVGVLSCLAVRGRRRPPAAAGRPQEDVSAA